MTDDDREQATSLLTTVENVAWTIGPAIAGLLLAARGQDVAYWVNAVTFLASALLVMRIPAHALRSDEPITKGHWSDLREGLGLVVGSRHLVTVLVVWSTAAVATACVNVAEVVFAKHDLDAGNIGLGLLVSATGVGLVIGSFFAASALGALGMTRVYGGALALMGAVSASPPHRRRSRSPPFSPVWPRSGTVPRSSATRCSSSGALRTPCGGGCFPS